jgi:MFS family permease
LSNPDPPVQPSPARRRSVACFYVVNFLWWISLYLYVPTLPLYIQTTTTSLGTVGTILSAYSLPQLLLRIPIGILSDRWGRRKPLVAAGIVLTSLGALSLGLAKTPGLLYLARFITGIGAAFWVVFPVYFTAYFPDAESGRAIGYINFIRSVALIVATPAGGFLAEKLGLSQPFFYAALFGIVGLPALLATRETRTAGMPVSWANFRAVATQPLLVVVSVMALLLQFTVFAAVFSFTPIYATSLGATSGDLGIITMINLAASALGSLWAVRVQRGIGDRATIVVSAVLLAAGLFATPFIASVHVLMAVQLAFGFGSGVLGTMLMALGIRDLPRRQQATAMGVFQAVYAVGMMAGPMVSGFVSGSGGNVAPVFYLAGAVSVVLLAMAFLPTFSRNAGTQVV